jgi:hypothetical protein
MGLFVWLINPHGKFALLAVTGAAAVVYAVMLVLLRTADDEERSIIRRTLRMRGSPPGTPE